MHQSIRLADWVFEVFIVHASAFVVFQIGWLSSDLGRLLAVVILSITLSLALRIALKGSLGAKISGFQSTRKNAVLLAWPLGLSISFVIVANIVNVDFSYLEAEGPFTNSVAFMASPLTGGVMIWGRLMIYFMLRLKFPVIIKINKWEASVIEATAN